jgi:hypothetical protein
MVEDGDDAVAHGREHDTGDQSVAARGERLKGGELLTRDGVVGVEEQAARSRCGVGMTEGGRRCSDTDGVVAVEGGCVGGGEEFGLGEGNEGWASRENSRVL